MEFVKCTLADGHFCVLNTGLYHVDTSQWCVTALFFKDNDKISDHCRPSLYNITRPQAHYLDQACGLSLLKHLYLCKSSVKTTALFKLWYPHFTLINLQPVCSAFSFVIKLPPYFKGYSTGFHVTLMSANLNIPKFTPSSFRVWTHFDLSNMTRPETKNLRKCVIPKHPN